MFRISLLVLIFVPAASAVAQNSYSFTGFTCPDAGADDTRAFGINDNNLIVGGCRSRGLHGFVRDGDTINTPVEPAGSNNSRIRGVNFAGLMVGFYSRPDFDFFHGFLRINDSTYRDIVPPDATGDSLALGINSLNEIVGGYVGADGNEHGFINSGDVYIAPADCPGYPNTQINGINDNETLVGFCNDGVNFTGAIYDIPSMTLTLFQCLNLGAVDTIATAINNNGVVVGAYDTPNTTHGFVTFDMGQTCIQIDFPDAPNTQVMGISTSGTLVGFYFDDDVNYIRSFVATPN